MEMDLNGKQYTLSEIKDKYFPNRELSSLRSNNVNISQKREAMLGSIKREPVPQPSQKSQEKAEQ